MFGKKKRGKKAKVGVPAHHDLVRSDFTAAGPNQLWLTEVTEHRTEEGKLYLCAIKDLWSNRIVGYSISDRMESKIAVDALNNAVARPRRRRGRGRRMPAAFGQGLASTDVIVMTSGYLPCPEGSASAGVADWLGRD